ncbi:MAG: outer membrane beta-barrel protein, partial [Bradymonadia bacterium]
RSPSLLAPSLIALCLGICLPAVSLGAGLLGPKRTALEKLEDGPAVTKRLLLRGGRFEASPGIGFTLNDAFQRTALLGLQLHYHITDSFAIGVSGYYGISFNSDLADRIEQSRPERSGAGAFAEIGLIVSAELTYTPIIGKFAVFGRNVFNYDLHVLAGAGGVQVGGDSPDLEAFNIAPVVGIGMRAFVKDGISVNLQLRDYLYASSLNAVPSDEGEAEPTESSFSNNFAITLSAGFFFPQEPKVEKSRR